MRGLLGLNALSVGESEQWERSRLWEKLTVSLAASWVAVLRSDQLELESGFWGTSESLEAKKHQRLFMTTHTHAHAHTYSRTNIIYDSPTRLQIASYMQIISP